MRKTDMALLATIDDGLMQLKNDTYWQVLVQTYSLEPLSGPGTVLQGITAVSEFPVPNGWPGPRRAVVE